MPTRTKALLLKEAASSSASWRRREAEVGRRRLQLATLLEQRSTKCDAMENNKKMMERIEKNGEEETGRRKCAPYDETHLSAAFLEMCGK